ncbi:hypothetical protein TIFTF001_035638 [Ficus carica]|uniref:Uncharacterized protein n=1 Tax=Ficus carica TaxID=3494 RepID=A0AA88J9V7_FICCA|nr:hypothetical protein TIFTF001_035638 [Ficus carica]
MEEAELLASAERGKKKSYNVASPIEAGRHRTGQPSGTPGDQTIGTQEIASADEILDVGNRGTQEIAKNAEISFFTLFYLVSLSYQPCCREDDVDDDEHHDQPRLCEKGGGNRVHPRGCFSDTELIVFSDDGLFFNSWGL